MRRTPLIVAVVVLAAWNGGPTVLRAQQSEATLTLDDAVQRALERNLDIQVERMNPEAVDLSISSLRAAYQGFASAPAPSGDGSRLQMSGQGRGRRSINRSSSTSYGAPRRMRDCSH